MNIESSHFQACKISKRLYPVHSETASVWGLGSFLEPTRASEYFSVFSLQFVPIIKPSRQHLSGRSLFILLARQLSWSSPKRQPSNHPALIATELAFMSLTGIQLTKEQFLNKNLSTTQGYIPSRSAGGAGKNTHFLTRRGLAPYFSRCYLRVWVLISLHLRGDWEPTTTPKELVGTSL